MSSYDWELEKARTNVWKHGVTFEEAETIDLDPFQRTWRDLAYVGDEDRFLTIAYSTAGRLLLVVTSEGGRRPKIISARRATKRERHAYETRP